MSTLLEFNLNHTIYVKLTSMGYDHLSRGHNSFIGMIPNWGIRSAEYYKNQADEHGYTKMQVWEFLQNFGPVTRLGGPMYYETNILIEFAHAPKGIKQ